MKKLSILVAALLACVALQAQWVDDPAHNTQIANCATGASEIYVSTDITTGDSYVQWHYQGENGWSPWLQRLNWQGEPQWPAEGIHITTPDFATWSPGYAMTAVEGGVVSVFRTLGPHHWAVKINADGTFPWGEHGIILFNGEGGGRSEVLAGDDGGVWALGTDMDSTFLQYVNADGTLRASVTIKDPARKCTNGVLVPSDNGVFVVYAKQTLQGYTNYIKEIYLAGYNKDGERIVPETLLFAQQTVGASYIHYAISDGIGGGYVFQWHSGIGGVYNTYVTHFDANGVPTISDPNGIAVHSPDASSFFINAYPTIDMVNNDLLLVYRQTDSYSQSQYIIHINRITPNGEKPWGDGILVLDNGTTQCGNLRIDSFEFLDGFSVIYHKAAHGVNGETIEAQGFDREGNVLWNTQMCSALYPKTLGENTPGYHDAQNLVVWVNTQDGGVYGQNLGEEGEMGEITIPVPPIPCCFEPDNFDGGYLYLEETSSFGAMLTWEAPSYNPLHYNLYRQQLDNGTTEVIEIDANATSFFDEITPGSYQYQLTAVYEDFESGFALTPYGDDYLIIEITSSPECTDDEILTVIHIYTPNGQQIRHTNLKALSRGVYIVQGLTSGGKLVTRKIIVE